MAMELQIYSPKPEQKFPVIKWNNEELKTEITAAMADYQNVVVTVDSEKDSKALRARLNKLLTAIETARKDMKAKVQEPLKLFEAQVKEVEEPIKTAIANIDGQLAEIKTMKQEQKRKDIQEHFEKGTFPEWLTLDQLWDEKWLNASVTIDKIIKDIEEKVRIINGNLMTINALPDFAFEAQEIYKQTLDFGEAVRRAKEMSEMQKRKAAIEAERQKGMPPIQQSEVQTAEEKHATDSESVSTPAESPKTPLNGTEQAAAKIYTFRFEVGLTAAQAAALKTFCDEQGIKLTRIQ